MSMAEYQEILRVQRMSAIFSVLYVSFAPSFAACSATALGGESVSAPRLSQDAIQSKIETIF
jgi:predicted secreted protein